MCTSDCNYLNCCDCGGNGCGCSGCWSCQACDECRSEWEPMVTYPYDDEIIHVRLDDGTVVECNGSSSRNIPENAVEWTRDLR